MVGILGFIGAALGVIWGLDVAKSSYCVADFVPKGGTCYRYFGQYFSDTTYYAVNIGLWGLGIGMVLGLLMIAAEWLSRRGVPANRDITG